MTRFQAYPYLRVDRGASLENLVVTTPASVDSGTMISLEGWDPGTDVSVIASVRLDLETVRESSALSSETTVRLALIWRCDATSLRGCGQIVELRLDEGDGPRDVNLTLLIPGHSVAQDLDVEARMSLARPGVHSSPLAANRSGHVLWTAARKIVLEGDGTRFPVEPVDFVETPGLPDHAAWHLEWDRDDLESPLHGRVRLLINSANPSVRTAVSDPTGAPESEVLVAAIEYQVARSLISGALSNPDFVVDPERFEEGSIGAAVRRLLHVAFAGYTTAEVAQMLERRPDTFDTQIQASLRLFGEVP